jgi:DNA-directed RNA polymerase specialized sigma subunit
MHLPTWRLWSAAPPGSARDAHLAALMRDNDALARKFSAGFIATTRYDMSCLKDDVLQACRIGLLRAIERWDHTRSAFSTVAYFWMQHEVRAIARNATPITRPWTAALPRAQQDANNTFFATHGREPTPAEAGISPAAAARAAHGQARFVGFDWAEDHGVNLGSEMPDPEGDIDRQRDVSALKTYLSRLSTKEQAAFWTGRRPDLTKRAKAYVDGRRRIR